MTTKRAWLRCEVRPGMFANEVAICITTADGSVVSFFLPAEQVQSLKGTEEKAIPVHVVDSDHECEFVALPRRSFEGPNIARVPTGALRFA
jgi:hypothetical protein